jgi:Glycosyl hydrolase family 115/Gylcosyl hydrolase family 115 C-terminal domain
MSYEKQYKLRFVSKNNLRYTSFFFCFVIIFFLVLFFSKNIFAKGAESQNDSYVTFQKDKSNFPLSALGKSAPLCISVTDYAGVIIAAKNLQNDISKVTGKRPELYTTRIPNSDNAVLVGTIGKGLLIDSLINQKKINVDSIKGKWETYLIQVVKNPFPNIKNALVIIGSDKRGTIYGIYDVSEKIGVSPWYWWADVPIKKHDNLYVKPDSYKVGPPTVKYRGIFLNDEWPDLTNWVIYKYGYVKPDENPPIPPGVANYGHEFYEHIFELLLRLKANYLWPAMWNNAFNEDDSLNSKFANEYGIVMGTSHQEPMLRAQKEWDRRYMKTLGPWNFAKFPDTLTEFWRKGIKRNRNYESIVTIGLRGENDSPMAHGGISADTALLGKIIRVQENILGQEMNPDVAKIPQLWCPYKEVLSYYNAGFRVPDCVTVLWTDDNWGNLRHLPDATERQRSGGAGIYYHFDYHGDPRNYQWINTNPLPKIWDQMSLAKNYDADKIWIVNVGHLKGYELPISYFMNLAWNTNRWTNNNIEEYTRLWAQQQFGGKYSKQIADILTKYTTYNGRCKPELLNPDTYSLVNYNEWSRVVSDFKTITDKAEKIYNALPENEHDAFYELVLLPTKASYILNDMYYAAAQNELYAKQGRANTNDMFDKTHMLFKKDTSLMNYFNNKFAGGKWDHFMDQPFIGYTSWNQPNKNNLDAINLSKINVPDSALMGIAVEGSENAWPGSEGEPSLPGFSPFNQQQHYIDVFNKGKIAFKYTASADKPWIKISSAKGKVIKQTRLWISVNWDNVPKGTSTALIKVEGANENISVKVNVSNPAEVTRNTLEGFMEADGYVSIEAKHYSKLSEAGQYKWINIQDYGNTFSGMRASAPADAPAAVPGKNSPYLKYKVFLSDTGKIDVEGVFSPTLNFMSGQGLQYAVSLDDNTPKLVTLVPENYIAGGGRDWAKSVIENMRKSSSSFTIDKPGYHTLKIWMVNHGVVLEKIIINCGGLKESFLGPPESFHRMISNN